MKRAGFTLFELILTTALMLLLMGGALAAYNAFLAQRGRSESGKKVVSLVREAQNRSRSGDKPESCGSLNGYRVWANNNSNQYSLSLRCDGSSEDLETVTNTLASGEYFLSGFDVIFPPTPGTVTGAPATVRIGQLEAAEYEYEFTIAASGVIEDTGLVQAE